MPWKLITFIAVMALVLLFVGFNLDNRCDISILFLSFHSVPVVITILSAYILGLVSALFLAIGRRSRPARQIPAGRTGASTVPGIQVQEGTRVQEDDPSGNVTPPAIGGQDGRVLASKQKGAGRRSRKQ